MSKVSVCCSVLNQSGWLVDMIASVMAQTHQDWELIVIDDGSTEPIRQVVEKFNDPRIVFERFDTNRGIPCGINHAFRMATGDYIKPMAADEMLTPDALAVQVAYLDAHSEINCVWGMPQFCGNYENKEVGVRPSWEQYQMKAHNRSREHWLRCLLLLEYVPLGSCSALWRRSVFDSIGYFDPSLTAFVDHEWYVRFFEKHMGWVIPHRLALCRPNPDNQAQAKYAIRNQHELERVRTMHPAQLPPVEGLITVGIPVYNMAHFIEDSIRSILAQTERNFELLIMDDASTDNLAEVLGKFQDKRITYYRFDENRGAHEATNQLAARANGLFFVPVSADDTIAPDFLSKCVATFKENPFLEFVASQTDFIDEKGAPHTDKTHGFHQIERASNKSQDEWKQKFTVGNVYFGVGMYRTSAFIECGGRKTQFGVISDYELYLNLVHRENIRIIEENLTHTRIHGKNMSLIKQEDQQKLRVQYYDAKKAYYPPRLKVILATPFYELKGFSPYISSMVHTVKLLTMMGIEHEFWELSGDSYVHRARNTICTKFLEDPAATDLFFIDSDMQWNPEAIINMVALPEGIVGGSYPVKNNWAGWTSIPVFKEENGRNHPMGRVLEDGSALIQANFLAAGFLRMKRGALEAYRDHYPEHRYKEPCADPSNAEREYIEFFASIRENGLLYGEDMMFSKRLKEMGQDMWIYTNVQMGHFGVKGWTGNYHQYLKSGGVSQNDGVAVQAIT